MIRRSPRIAHFAINANDLPRAQRFYGNVFGWKFSPYGPPGFFMIENKPLGRSCADRCSSAAKS